MMVGGTILKALGGRLTRRSQGGPVRWVGIAFLLGMLPLPVLAGVVALALICASMIGGAVVAQGNAVTCQAGCAPTTIAPGETKQAIARNLIASGKLIPLANNPDHLFEIAAIASGAPIAGCDIDIRILAILTILANHFDTVGVSDINRHCTGQIEGAGTLSSHWINGGGDALDIYAINGVELRGDDNPYSLEIIALLDPLMPDGARVGQIGCRTNNSFVHLEPFVDECTHLHLDVAFTTGSGALLP